MTPTQYVRAALADGKFPNMPIDDLAGTFYLCNADWAVIPGGKPYSNRDAAECDRSRIIERASKAFFK